MKNYLRFACFTIALTIAQLSDAQLTKLSNNTDLNGLLINGKPLLVSDADNTLWTTDGTPSGTVQYTNKVTLEEDAGLLGGKLYFNGTDQVNGSELWVTDGTDAGTALIKDIEPDANSSKPENFFPYNNELFFFATTTANGKELWKTNGTAAGTVLVKDINPGPGGTEVNIVNYFVNNGVLFFSANDGTHGNELWRTDGTEAGTIMVKDINPGAGSGIGGDINILTFFVAIGTRTLFTANDGTTGSELWATDGTSSGTVLVKDIYPNSLGSSPYSLLAFNNKVYFSAQTEAEGFELWSTDGTTAGTNLVKDISPGQSNSFPNLFSAIIFGNELVFTANSDEAKTQLWSTDGTAIGTVLLKDFNPQTSELYASLLPNYRTDDLSFSGLHTPPFNGKVFISEYDEDQGTNLWITDGTAAGTVLVKNISMEIANDVSQSYFYTQNALFFSGGTSVSGSELWKSDGTSAGTGLIQDINPGPESSDPEFNFVYNNHLFITANDGDNADNISDFYSLDENVTLPISLYNFAATAQPKRAVKLEWNTTNESNSSHFNVERSADGVNFSSIDKVNAAGNSALSQHYQYTDQQPVHLRNPVLFYRLKMVDKDASFKYSRILPIHFKESSFEFTFSPNPVQNQLSVVIAAAGSKKIALRITDASGKQIYQRTLSASQTINQQNINTAGWQKGIYYIQLITDNTTKTKKIVKQ